MGNLKSLSVPFSMRNLVCILLNSLIFIKYHLHVMNTCSSFRPLLNIQNACKFGHLSHLSLESRHYFLFSLGFFFLLLGLWLHLWLLLHFIFSHRQMIALDTVSLAFITKWGKNHAAYLKRETCVRSICAPKAQQASQLSLEIWATTSTWL